MSATLSRAFPVARRLHRCASCGDRIEAGERYHRWKGTTDVTEGIVTMKECAGCFERYLDGRIYLDPENVERARRWMAEVGVEWPDDTPASGEPQEADRG